MVFAAITALDCDVCNANNNLSNVFGANADAAAGGGDPKALNAPPPFPTGAELLGVVAAAAAIAVWWWWWAACMAAAAESPSENIVVLWTGIVFLWKDRDPIVNEFGYVDFVEKDF